MIEGREGMNNSGVTVVGSDAPSDYHIAPRTEAPSKLTTTTGSVPQSITSQLAASSPPYAAAPPPAGVTPLTEKKKRGRPRKYAPDGSVRKALSPKPISSAAPPVIDFSTGKRGKIKPHSASKHQRQPPKEMEALGDWVSCSVGANFMPHIINVNTGEDVTMKVISFSQQGPCAICILSANGVISSVTLRQPNSSGGTLTYEGRFEILSLAGSFIPSESGGIRNKSGGMSVSLSSPDGRVVGGSDRCRNFLDGCAVGTENHQEAKAKKRIDHGPYYSCSASASTSTGWRDQQAMCKTKSVITLISRR